MNEQTHLAGVDISRIVQDFAWLTEGRMNRITQQEDTLILDVYAQGKRGYLILNPPSMLLWQTVKPAGTPIHGFARVLRQHLEKARITMIGTRFADRVFWIQLERGDWAYRLILEYFGKGNIILTRHAKPPEGDMTKSAGEDWQILTVREQAEYGVRSLKPGAVYQLPPGGNVSYEQTDWLEGEKHLVSLLARHGLGGKYADHIIRQLHISAEASWKDLSEEQREKLKNILRGYADPIGWMLKDGVPWLVNLALGEEATYTSYLDLPLRLPTTLWTDEKREKEDKPSARARQEAYKRELEREISILTRQGEWYYEHYTLAKEIEAFLTAYWEEHHSLEGIDWEWPDEFPPLVRREGKRVWIGWGKEGREDAPHQQRA